MQWEAYFDSSRMVLAADMNLKRPEAGCEDVVKRLFKANEDALP
jgi:hypothetical protein